MAIYAACANHLAVLSRSPLVDSWHDRLWAVVGAVHSHAALQTTHNTNIEKARSSGLYKGTLFMSFNILLFISTVY